MLKTAIALIVFLIAAVWLGIVLAQDPGMALFSWRDTTVEMPLWFAGCSLVLALFVIWQLSYFFHAFPHALYRLKQWRDKRKMHRQVCHLRDGLLDLLEQRWARSEKRLSLANALFDFHPLDKLGAAFAAHRQGDHKRRDAWLAQAGSAPASILLQADFCLDDGRPEEAVSLLASRSKDPGSLMRLQKAYRRLEQWDALFALMPALRKAAIVTPEKADRLEQKAVKNGLATANSADSLHAMWQRLPRHLRKDPRLIRCFIMQLLHFPGTTDKALALLTASLARQFDPRLIALYGRIVSPDAKKQLTTAEKWLNTNPHQPALLLALGQISLHCRIWGKARGYLNDCLEYDPSNTKAFALLGWLDEQAGDTRAALTHYREGLRDIIKEYK